MVTLWNACRFVAFCSSFPVQCGSDCPLCPAKLEGSCGADCDLLRFDPQVGVEGEEVAGEVEGAGAARGQPHWQKNKESCSWHGGNCGNSHGWGFWARMTLPCFHHKILSTPMGYLDLRSYELQGGGGHGHQRWWCLNRCRVPSDWVMILCLW